MAQGMSNLYLERELILIDETALQQDMKTNRVPLGYRDSCAHLLIPLNQCRLREFYLPWKCEDERYSSQTIN